MSPPIADALWEAFQRAEPIETLEVEFYDGKAFDNFTCHCKCGEQCDPGYGRGELRNLGANSYWLLSLGICKACKKLNVNVAALGVVDDNLFLQDETDNPRHPFQHLLPSHNSPFLGARP